MRQGCVAVMSMTWIASVAVFGMVVLPKGGYYFNDTGLLACEPFFSKASFRYVQKSPFQELKKLSKKITPSLSIRRENWFMVFFAVKKAINHRGNASIFIVAKIVRWYLRRALYKLWKCMQNYCASRILLSCSFYFPTTMALMYFYGSAFHENKLRMRKAVCINTPEIVTSGHFERVRDWTNCSSIFKVFCDKNVKNFEFFLHDLKI